MYYFCKVTRKEKEVIIFKINMSGILLKDYIK